LNSTLKSLLFWMVLVIVGVLIWNFSTAFQTRDNTVQFSKFIEYLDQGNVVQVTMTGNEIVGTLKQSFGEHRDSGF